MAQFHPQPGIFALGTPAHAYFEFDLLDERPETVSDIVASVATIPEATASAEGCNIVLGLRPSLCDAVLPDSVPAETTDFDEPIVGDDGFTMPATQRDVFVWISSGSYDHVFDLSLAVTEALAPHAKVVTELRGWPYRRDRDLTGFIDGSENPPVVQALDVAIAPADAPGAGSSVLLFQQWQHDTQAWVSLGDAEQEKVMGRSKADSTEFTDKSPTSHVARTDQDQTGHIFRRNMPYGTTTQHGTVFVGFAASQAPLSLQLHRMAGVDGESRDDLTRYTTPLTGAYYVMPSIDALQSLLTPEQLAAESPN